MLPRRVRCWRSFRRGTGLHEVTTSWSGHDCSTQRALNSFGVALDPTAMRVAGSSSNSKTFAWAFREAEHEKASKVPTLRRMEVLGVQVMVLHTVLFEVAPDASAWVSDCFWCRIMAIVCVIVRRCDGVSAPRWPCDCANQKGVSHLNTGWHAAGHRSGQTRLPTPAGSNTSGMPG